MFRKWIIAVSALVMGTAPAFAHLNPAEHGSFAAGFSHPLFGADHILAMVAVGLWAALLAHGPESRNRFSESTMRSFNIYSVLRASKWTHGAVSGRALWLVPAAFVITMSAGFAFALAGAPLPFVEPVILASVVAIGLLAAIALRVPTSAAMAMVGFFALFHGHAHGGEMGAAGAAAYGLGFAAATVLLHIAGIGIGLGLPRLFGNDMGRVVARLAGGATALAGLWLAVAG
ncbi:protein hupE [Phyllobacterium salinisoli]|uniref:Protein hupE n=1 Tax=Phyllobacterium salinisoli TaxID=1899321 RepID=A0A368K794_9HYPH|nr:HupE/UreJ family protein [Phyllobacterium salinisoli]RCS25219.1 protein hupE [Phyllobacterium salinisoli]